MGPSPPSSVWSLGQRDSVESGKEAAQLESQQHRDESRERKRRRVRLLLICGAALIIAVVLVTALPVALCTGSAAYRNGCGVGAAAAQASAPEDGGELPATAGPLLPSGAAGAARSSQEASRTAAVSARSTSAGATVIKPQTRIGSRLCHCNRCLSDSAPPCTRVGGACSICLQSHPASGSRTRPCHRLVQPVQRHKRSSPLRPSQPRRLPQASLSESCL